jgi:hypothetical protein
MSDYLNGLVARSLSLAQVIKPRVPSLFEPQAIGGRLSAHGLSVKTKEDDALSETVTETVARPRPSEQRKPGQRWFDDSVELREGRSQATVPTLVIPQPVEAKAEQARAAPPIQAPTIEPPAPQPILPTPETRTITRAAQELDRPVVTQSGTRIVMEKTVIQDKPQRQALLRLEPSIPPQAQRLPELPVGLRPREKPGGREAKAPAEPQSKPEPAPTIHVTIGRIEVRATTPSAPPHKQRTEPQVMSLDEYLRQRAGRGGA